MKYCAKCLTDKPKDDFHKNKSSKDGCVNRCKKCCSDVHKENRLKVEMAIEVLKTFEEECPDEYKRVIKKINERNTERN